MMRSFEDECADRVAGACASVSVGNVQPHSAGDLFPWRIDVVDNIDNHGLGVGYVQCVNSETGEEGEKWHFNRCGSGFGSQRHADVLACAEALAMINAEVHRNALAWVGDLDKGSWEL